MSLSSKIRYVINGIISHVSPYYNHFFYYIGSFMPVIKGLILFESQPDYCDNSYSLYRYLQNNSEHLRLEWIVNTLNNEDASEKISNLKLGFCAQTYIKIARAEYIFFSHNYPYFKRKNRHQTVVYMTHGCPIKKNKSKGIENPPTDYTETPNFDYAICIGDGAIKPQAIFCMCKPERILPLGYPRNDDMLASKADSSTNPFNFPGIEKIILWMPTFRASHAKDLSESTSQSRSGLPIIENKEMLDKLNDYLAQNKLLLLVKIHRLQSDYPIFSHRYSNISFLTDTSLAQKGIRLYEMIAKTDALLTDYSSVYFDYLLLDRPIGFTLADYNEYGKDRGYVFEDTKSILVGHHIYYFGQLLTFLDDIKRGFDPHANKRNKLKDFFHADTKGISSQRIANHFHLTHEPLSSK